MKTKISSSEEYGTVVTLTSENEEEAEALKALWNRKGEVSSLEKRDPGTIEIELATTE